MTMTDIELKELSDRRRADAAAVKEKLANVGRIEVPELTSVKVNKFCRDCGYRWRGYFFKEWLATAVTKEIDGKRYVRATCDACVEKWERDALRREIETDLQTVDNALKMGLTKPKKIRFMRSKVRILARLRDTYDPGGVDWSKQTDRIREMNEAINRIAND
jgi:hypothetical protein